MYNHHASFHYGTIFFYKAITCDSMTEDIHVGEHAAYIAERRHHPTNKVLFINDLVVCKAEQR